jgi:hypothetical protein
MDGADWRCSLCTTSPSAVWCNTCGRSLVRRSWCLTLCVSSFPHRAGMTTINDFGVNYLVQALPFGGVKFSGFDRFAGPEGLRACCLMKSVVIDKVSFIKTSIPKPLQVSQWNQCNHHFWALQSDCRQTTRPRNHQVDRQTLGAFTCGQIMV